MKEKRNFKQEFKDWWNDNKKSLGLEVCVYSLGLFTASPKELTVVPNLLEN